MSLESICVFAGFSDGSRREYRIAAESLGRLLAMINGAVAPPAQLPGR